MSDTVASQKVVRFFEVLLNIDERARIGAGREFTALHFGVRNAINATNRNPLNSRRCLPVLLRVFRSASGGEWLRDERGAPVLLSESARSTGGITVVARFECPSCGLAECEGTCGQELGAFIREPVAAPAKVEAPRQFIVMQNARVNLRGTGAVVIERGRVVSDPSVLATLRAVGVLLQPA